MTANEAYRRRRTEINRAIARLRKNLAALDKEQRREHHLADWGYAGTAAYIAETINGINSGFSR